MSERQTTREFKNYRTSNSSNIENALKCLKLDMLDNTQIELLLNYIDKLQKENKEYQELTDNLRGENAELRDDLDKKQKENEELKEDNKFLNFLAHWNNQGRYYPYLETSYTDTSYFIKKSEIIKIVNSFVEEMNELLDK